MNIRIHGLDRIKGGSHDGRAFGGMYDDEEHAVAGAQFIANRTRRVRVVFHDAGDDTYHHRAALPGDRDRWDVLRFVYPFSGGT